MKMFGLIASIITLLGSNIQAQNDSFVLDSLIQSFENHKSYNEKDYPLGLFTESHYKAEAEFAEELSEALKTIDSDSLSETESISLALLKFVLEDKINYFKFERYLNPILSDAGFHSNLTYMVRPLTTYSQVKTYLNK